MLGALSTLFRSADFDVLTYETVQDFFSAPCPELPSCLVVDVRLPGMSGLDFQDELAKRNIALPVILMTGYADVPMSVRGMKAGALDFLTKPFKDQEMLGAVTRAVSKDTARRVQDCIYDELRGRYATLTRREKEVAQLVAAGRMNKHVADALNISEVTVKVHRAVAMRKMAAHTLPDLVRMIEKLHPGVEASTPDNLSV